MSKNTRIVTIIFLVLAAVGAALMLSDSINAADPTGVHVTLFQTDLLLSTSSTPVTIFTSTVGNTVDIVGNPNSAFGSGKVAVGTYKRIHFKVQNEIIWGGPDPCTGPDITNASMLIDGGKAPDAQVDLVFATADDNGSSGWTANGSPGYPFLLQTPIKVEDGANTVVKLMFLTAGTVQCTGTGGTTAELHPPDMSTVTYVVRAPAATGGCNFNADQKYWFVHYNFNNWVKDYLISQGTPTAIPTQEEVLMNSGVSVGWGTVTFSAVDSSGTGTWTLVPGYMASEDPGRGYTEHRHRLRGWDPTNTPEEGLNDPASPGVLVPMGDRYTVAGQKIIMNMKEGGYIEGAVSDNCDTFMGVNITSPGENDIIFAVKKPTIDMSGRYPNGQYQLISNSFDISYDKLSLITGWPSTSGTAYPAQWMSFQPNPGFFDTLAFGGTSTGGGMIGWKPHYPLSRTWGASPSWTSNGPEERVDWQQGFNAMFAGSTVSSDGLWSITSDTHFDAFIALNDHDNGIFAGSVLEEDTRPGNDPDRSQHYLQAGLVIKTADNPTIAEDLAGRWVIGVIESSIQQGSGTWYDGDENAQLGLTYGEVTIGSTGSVATNFTHKDAFTGDITSEVGSGETVVIATECYAYNDATNAGMLISTPTASCQIPGTSTQGMTNTVFYIKAGSTVEAKLVLNKDKNTVAIYRPVDTDGTPYSAPSNTRCAQSPTPVINWCGDAQNSAIIGMGVKVQ